MKSCALRRARRGLDLARGVACGAPYAMLLRDRVVEQHGLLRHDADLPPQRRQRHVADVDAVDQDAAGADVVEPRQQVDERRLAGAAPADDRHHLPGLHA